MTKNFQQTPKQRRLQNKKVEAAKRQLAQSKPYFNPRESFTSHKKVNGVPLSTLEHKQLSALYPWGGYPSYYY